MTELCGRTVAIVGLGYVGLPTALGLAETGARLIGFDDQRDRLADIKAGAWTCWPDDQARLAVTCDSRRVPLTTEPAALAEADAIVICVPTPVDEHLVPGPACAARGAAPTWSSTPRLADHHADLDHLRRLHAGARRGAAGGPRVQGRAATCSWRSAPSASTPGEAPPRRRTPRVVGGVTRGVHRGGGRQLLAHTPTPSTPCPPPRPPR